MQFFQLNYDTIQDANLDTIDITYPAWRNKPGIFKYTAPIPPSESLSYWTGSRNSWRIKPPKSSMSFEKIKQLRLIKMTPLDVGETIHRNFEVRRKRFSFKPYREWTSTCGDPNYRPVSHAQPGFFPRSWSTHGLLKSSWTEVIDGDRLIRSNSEMGLPFYKLDDRPELIGDTLNDVKSSCISDAFSGFDLLTNLAEAPESLELIISALKLAVNPLRGIRELREKYAKARRRGKTHREAHDEISSQWMQYRYGIMPIILSIKDAMELYDQLADEFSTSRAYQKIPYVESSKPLITGVNYFHQESTGSIRVSAVGKSRYSDPNLRLSDLITFNPFLTAWELIPMSFVIDWFVNVGDVIFSHTSTLLDLAVQRKFCASVKKDFTINTLFTEEQLFLVKYHHDGWSNPSRLRCGGTNGALQHEIPSIDLEDEELVRHRSIITSDTVRSYDRSLFNPTDVEFKINPSMSWMRYIDAYVLSLKPILKALKSLK